MRADGPETRGTRGLSPLAVTEGRGRKRPGERADPRKRGGLKSKRVGSSLQGGSGRRARPLSSGHVSAGGERHRGPTRFDENLGWTLGAPTRPDPTRPGQSPGAVRRASASGRRRTRRRPAAVCTLRLPSFERPLQFPGPAWSGACSRRPAPGRRSAPVCPPHPTSFPPRPRRRRRVTVTSPAPAVPAAGKGSQGVRRGAEAGEGHLGHRRRRGPNGLTVDSGRPRDPRTEGGFCGDRTTPRGLERWRRVGRRRDWEGEVQGARDEGRTVTTG